MQKHGMGLKKKADIMDSDAMARALTRISFEIIERNRGAQELCIVGILGGGAPIAQRLARKISELEGAQVPCGALDITAFRDDRELPDGHTDLSDLPFSIEGRRVVLVDDVLHTGRSARAAIDALMARGRPRAILLAVLVDRGHRELPIRADFIGKNLPTSSDEAVHVKTVENDGVDEVLILVQEH